MAVVIYGPKATGKTLHAERFRSLYRCARVVELDEQEYRHTKFQPQRYDLMLTIMSREAVLRRFPGARVVSIQHARKAAGMEPAPKGGFFAGSAK